ncbi:MULTISPECIES: hypothetical protein [unclassified Streptomyces]|uniref:VMAP-C domain-containing protein n=1 Tax=unclassified Streptomyces TaxID=2593676 RepID=UPI00224F3981|nr:MULTISPECIES: hypothetical protein [unclassified Streptomyces]MCX4987873.1 hypothetical protein [Streptomyces sp. NBC_00568]MCX5006995.1 hypothetical protein [Streptomyces sp. NBC_00638]
MIDPRSLADSARRELPRYLVDAVQQLTCLDDPAALRRLVSKFDPAPAAPSSASGSTQRAQLVRLMEGLCGAPGGLTPMVQTLEVWEGSTVAVLNLKIALAAWEVDLFAYEEWEELFRLLDGLRVPDLSRQYADFLREHGRFTSPAHCTEPWAVFLHAATLNARSGEPLPCFQLLRRLALAAEGDRQFAITDWVDDHDPHSSLPDDVEPKADEQEAAARADVWSPSDYLIIRLRPLLDGDGEGTTILSHWRRVHPGGQVRGEDRRIAPTDLEQEVRALIHKAESDWAYFLKGELAIEFVLPWDLLHLPVENWEKSSFHGVGAVLGEDHPVVIRSLERLDRRDLHGRWGRRWDAFAQRRAGSAHWFAYDSLAHLLSDPPPAVAVLSSAPGDTSPSGDSPPHSPDELGEALRAGVPVVLWDRRGGGDPDFRAALRAVLESSDPRRLPTLVKSLRITSRDRDSEDPMVGRHVALLWDDPYRLPVAMTDSSASIRDGWEEKSHDAS